MLLPGMILSHQQINLKESWPLVLDLFDVPPIATGEAVGRPGQASEVIGPVCVLQGMCLPHGLPKNQHRLPTEQGVMQTGCWDALGKTCLSTIQHTLLKTALQQPLGDQILHFTHGRAIARETLVPRRARLMERALAKGGNGSNLRICTQWRGLLGAAQVREGLSAEQGSPGAAAKLIFNAAFSIISYSLDTPPK